MKEQLIIRLGSQAEATISWLICTQEGKEVIASGELANAASLDVLAEKQTGRSLVVLVPASDVSFHSVTLPRRAQRSWQQAVPFLIEEKSVEPIENLHLVAVSQDAEGMLIAALSHQKMQMWQQQLQGAGLASDYWAIDALCLPQAEDQQLNLLQLQDQWLVRGAKSSGFSIDESSLEPVLAAYIAADTEINGLNFYSPAAEGLNFDGVEVSSKTFELPLKLLASGLASRPINLRQGAYKNHSAVQQHWQLWRKVAVLAVLSIGLAFTHSYLELRQTQAELTQVNQQVRSVYQRIFPEVQRVRDSRIRQDMNTALAQLDQPKNQGFIEQLDQLSKHFAETENFEAQTLRYDASRKEFRIVVQADGFQRYEEFKQRLVDFEYQQGALSNQNDLVSGTITLRGQ